MRFQHILTYHVPTQILKFLKFRYPRQDPPDDLGTLLPQARARHQGRLSRGVPTLGPLLMDERVQEVGAKVSGGGLYCYDFLLLSIASYCDDFLLR